MKDLKNFLGQISRYKKKSEIFGENKAIFVTGVPGSGKDVIIREILSHVDITEINHLQAYNYLQDKKRLNEKSNDYRRESFRNHFPIIINAPADDFDKINYIKEELEKLGYSSLMVFVNTTNSVSKERNENLSRMMIEAVRHNRWSLSQNNKSVYKDIFENFIQIDNNDTLEEIQEEIQFVYKKINKYLVSESKPSIIKLNPELTADGPADVTPDNRPGESKHGDDIKGDTPARKNPNKSYIFKTYSEDAKLVVFPEPKKSNFSKDKESKKKDTTSPNVNQRLRNTSGISPEFDTRQQGTVYPMSGLGDVTYRESRDFKGFRNKLKEAIDDPGAVDMGVGGTLNGATNKEPMQSYKDQERNIGIKIKKKGNKNV